MKGIKSSGGRFSNIYLIVFGVILAVIGFILELVMLINETYIFMLLMLGVLVLAIVFISNGVTRNLSSIEALENKVNLKYPKLINGTANQGGKYSIEYSKIEEVTFQQDSVLIKTSTGTYLMRQLENAEDLCKFINSKLVKKESSQNLSIDDSHMLEQLYNLYQNNIITKEEYEAKKKEILSRI